MRVMDQLQPEAEWGEAAENANNANGERGRNE